jgi:hypothetical protein
VIDGFTDSGVTSLEAFNGRTIVRIANLWSADASLPPFNGLVACGSSEAPTTSSGVDQVNAEVIVLSSVVLEDFKIDLPPDRDQLRTGSLPRFAELRSHVWEQIQRAKDHR